MAAARVLVVDDDELHLVLMERLLSKCGLQVVPATGPRQALEIIKNDCGIDVIVSDVQMPQMPGTELVREAAQILPATASLLLTGGPVDPTEVPPGVAVLRKPIATRDLLAAVQAAFAKSLQLRMELAASRETNRQLKQENERLRAETEEAGRKAVETIRRSQDRLRPKGIS
jgi:response regulator RpfG family c-di-GMP phosphodiesterase